MDTLARANGAKAKDAAPAVPATRDGIAALIAAKVAGMTPEQLNASTGDAAPATDALSSGRVVKRERAA
jgi:hypothetical protein